jgi:hypothetical protein
LAILREPQQLRARVIDAYGYDRFVSHLACNLAKLGLHPRLTSDL